MIALRHLNNTDHNVSDTLFTDQLIKLLIKLIKILTKSTQAILN